MQSIMNNSSVLISFLSLFPSDPTHLCDVVISMVAVVLATPPFSSYLWYHLFAVDKLQDAYTTVFKVHVNKGHCIPIIEYVIVPIILILSELPDEGYTCTKPVMHTYNVNYLRLVLYTQNILV